MAIICVVDVRELDKELSVIISSAWADNTISTRKSQWKKYIEFCNSHGLLALPASYLTVARFMTYLARFCKFTTINNYLSSIIVLHKYHGHPAGFRETFYMQLVIKGLKRILGDEPRQSIPLTPEQLLACHKTVALKSTLEVACWAAVVLCFRTLLRKSNVLPDTASALKLSHLVLRKDVRFHSWGMTVTVYSSKTIQFRERNLEIPVFKIDGSPLCAVELLRQHWMGFPAEPDSPLFLKINKKNEVTPLLYRDVLNQLKDWVARIRLSPTKVGLHSLRRSGATFMCRLGIPLSDIKCMGDWRSLAVLEYLITPMSRKLQIESKCSEALKELY